LARFRKEAGFFYARFLLRASADRYRMTPLGNTIEFVSDGAGRETTEEEGGIQADRSAIRGPEMKSALVRKIQRTAVSHAYRLHVPN